MKIELNLCKHETCSGKNAEPLYVISLFNMLVCYMTCEIWWCDLFISSKLVFSHSATIL